MKDYNHHSTTLSEPFLTHLLNKEEFKSKYTYYCVNYEKSNKLVKEETVSNSSFASLLKELSLYNSSNAL